MPPAPKPAHTYRLGFRALDEQISSSDLDRRVARALLALADPAKGIVIQTICRPPQHDGAGLYLAAITSGPEHWYLQHDDYLLSMGLRCELMV